MRSRREASARYGDNPSAMSRLVQAQHDIDHGQPGANDQDIAAAGGRTSDRGTAGIAPWIADEQLRRNSPRKSRQLRRMIALGQDQRGRVDDPAIGQLDIPFASVACRLDGMAGHELYKAARLRI